MYNIHTLKNGKTQNTPYLKRSPPKSKNLQIWGIFSPKVCIFPPDSKLGALGAPIRSASKFYIDLDVRKIFQLLRKKNRSIQKKSEIFGNFRKSQKFPKISEKYFWIDRIFIWKTWEINRTSWSMQNLLADRMVALSGSENHSEASYKKYTFSLSYLAK